MRETQKDFKIKERTFRVKKFNAFLANGILRDLVTTALPINISEFLPIANLGGMVSKTMSIIEFADFQKLLLSQTYELLPAGETLILDNQGNFAVIDLEYDQTAIFELFKEVIIFNFGGFFIESLSLLGITKVQGSDGK